MKNVRTQVDPVTQRRVTGGVALAFGLTGLYQVYQASQGLHDTTYVPLVYAASALTVAAGILAILRPVRATGWLVNLTMLGLVGASCALNLLTSHTGY